MNFIKHLSAALILPLLILSSCKKDSILTDTAAKLDFSTDSVLFDTVFTQVGSTTKQFKIYNNHKQKLNISKIFLATGSASQYRMNVDGVSGTSINDVEILGGDSMFVFVQVTVNPTNQNSPLLIRDSIVFVTNGNTQDVKLTAIGQDVYLHKPDHFPTNGFPAYSITSSQLTTDTTLPNDKPHLFFGAVVVDSDKRVFIQKGTHIYLHNNSFLWVYIGGTLIAKGEKNNEIVFQGDRLEADFKELPGQWDRIWFYNGSKNNIMDWTIIKNGNIGVQAEDDTTGASTNPVLTITNSIIKNMSTAAIYSRGSFIRSANCVFANCVQYVAALTGGGKYKFEQCTFANYINGGNRTTPSLFLSDYNSSDNTIKVRPLDAYFGNCILYGNIADEIGIDSAPNVSVNFSYMFDHCLLKTTSNISNVAHYDTAYQNSDPGFKDVSGNDYQLKVNAFAIDKGNTLIAVSPDLNGNPRPIGGGPDLGAYEFQ
jgi:hypothetical protein